MDTENAVLAEAPDAAPEETLEDIMSDAFIKKAAALAAAGTSSKNGLAKALKISNYFAGKIMADERFKKQVAEIGDDAVAMSKAQLKSDLSRLGKKAIVAIEKNLDKHNLQAAITVLRAMGVETAAKDEDAGKGGLTLILAGEKPAPQKATINVVKEEK